MSQSRSPRSFWLFICCASAFATKAKLSCRQAHPECHIPLSRVPGSKPVRGIRGLVYAAERSISDGRPTAQIVSGIFAFFYDQHPRRPTTGRSSGTLPGQRKGDHCRGATSGSTSAQRVPFGVMHGIHGFHQRYCKGSTDCVAGYVRACGAPNSGAAFRREPRHRVENIWHVETVFRVAPCGERSTEMPDHMFRIVLLDILLRICERHASITNTRCFRTVNTSCAAREYSSYFDCLLGDQNISTVRYVAFSTPLCWILHRQTAPCKTQNV